MLSSFLLVFMRNLGSTLNCCLLILVQLFLTNQEQSNREVDKDFWKSILDLIPYEVIQCLNPGKPIDLSRMYQILVKLFGSTIWKNIPKDILMQIFLRLLVTSLIRFHIFSKDCYKMISSTHFIKQQLKLAIKSNADIKLFMENLDGKVYLVGFSVTQDTYLSKQIALPFSSKDHALNFQGYAYQRLLPWIIVQYCAL